MAKKLYTEVGGLSKKVKKLYTEVGGVSHKVKKLYAEVNGLSKLVFNSFDPFTFTFSTYPYCSPSVSDYCRVEHWTAGYNADGLPCIDMFTWNATTPNGGEPCGRITFNFNNPEEMYGREVIVKYTKSFDTDNDGNKLFMIRVVNGTHYTMSLSGTDGTNRSFRRTIQNGETSFYIEAIAGGDGNVGCDIIITSVTVDGEEVLR